MHTSSHVHMQMKSGSLTASTETMKTKKTQILDNIEQKQQEMSAAAAYRQEINVKKECVAKRVCAHGPALTFVCFEYAVLGVACV